MGGAHQGPYYLGQPPQTFTQPEPILWTSWSLWFLWLQDAPQQQPLRNLKGTRFINHKSWRVHDMPKGHTERLRIETEDVLMHRELCLYEHSRTVCPGFQGFLRLCLPFFILLFFCCTTSITPIVLSSSSQILLPAQTYLWISLVNFLFQLLYISTLDSFFFGFYFF